LLHTIGTKEIAKVGVAELTFEDTPLLLFHSATRLQRHPYNPLQILVGYFHFGIGEQQLGETAHRLVDRFNITAAERTT
jgi:hypothetical protein